MKHAITDGLLYDAMSRMESAMEQPGMHTGIVVRCEDYVTEAAAEECKERLLQSLWDSAEFGWKVQEIAAGHMEQFIRMNWDEVYEEFELGQEDAA